MPLPRAQKNGSFFLPQGGSKIQDAYYIYQELSEKFLQTSYLLNGSAVCNIHKGNFEEAESLLQEALQKVPNFKQLQLTFAQDSCERMKSGQKAL